MIIVNIYEMQSYQDQLRASKLCMANDFEFMTTEQKQIILLLKI